MPKRTDAGWQTLANRIAREVMGWYSSQGFWRDDKINIYLDGPHFFAKLKLWQPHKELTQALSIMSSIAERGWLTALDVFTHRDGLMKAQIWKQGGYPYFEGGGETHAEAICLTVEQWLNAQELKIE